jgi:hypothetical protein
VAVPLTGTGDSGVSPTYSSVADCTWLASPPRSASTYCVPSDGALELLAPDGTSTRIAATAHSAKAAVADDTYLYWADYPTPQGVVMKVSFTDGDVSVVSNEAAVALAVDDTAIYWATPNGSIRRLLK